MARTNALVSLFENVSLDEKPQKHILEIQYPVKGLLPPGHQPVLKRPANLSQRDAPPHDQRRLGISQSACYLSYSTQGEKNPNDGHLDILISLNNAFASLTSSPGKSVLEAAVFFDGEMGHEMIRLCLHSSFKHDEEPHDYDFELSRDDWSKMVQEREWTWVDALDELITRRTDCAYYHVRNRLICDFGEEVSVGEEATWSAGWGSTKARQVERAETTVDDLDRLLEGIDL